METNNQKESDDSFTLDCIEYWKKKLRKEIAALFRVSKDAVTVSHTRNEETDTVDFDICILEKPMKPKKV